MKEILIIHPELHHYRIPIFNKLGERYQITVAHSGVLRSLEEQVKFSEVKVNIIKIGPFVIQKDLFNLCQKADYIIAGFDLHYINSFLLSIVFKEKFIWFGHGFGKSKVANFIKLFFVKCAKSILVYTKDGKNKLVKAKIDKNKIFITDNTLYIPNLEYNSILKRDHIIYVGRLQKRKKIDELIIAFSKIQDIYCLKIKLLIIGDGPIKHDLEELSIELGIKELVEFKGKITDNEILKKYFQSSLAYISPGDIGLGVLHSFAYGVPVITREIASHGPEFSNLKKYKNSLLYDGSVDELTLLIEMLIKNVSISRYLGLNGFYFFKNERSIENMLNAFLSSIHYCGLPILPNLSRDNSKDS